MMRHINISIGLTALVLGSLAMIFGGLMLVKHRDDLRLVMASSGQENDLQAHCIMQARHLDLTIHTDPQGTLRIEAMRLAQPEDLFARASVWMASCHGYDLHAFCAGSECPGQPFFMELKPLSSSP